MKNCRVLTMALVGGMTVCGSMAFAQMRGAAPPQSPNQNQNPNQNPNITDSMAAMQAGAMDRNFMREAMEGNLAEVDLGKLALEKSNNDQVKKFAQLMVDDHTKLNDQLKPIADQFSISIPSRPSKKQRKIYEKMQALSGTDFDQAYIKDMVQDHREDLKDFQTEASSGNQQAIKDAANRGSQMINGHLQMAQQLAKDQNVAIPGQ